MIQARESTIPARFSGEAFPALLGIIGPQGSGKTSLARAVQKNLTDSEMGERLRFAGPLKRMVGHLLQEAGVDDVERYLDGDRKQFDLSSFLQCKVTPRDLMRTLGTEWGRRQVDKDLWMNLCLNRARKARGAGKIAMIDDARFPNEVKAIRWHGGAIVRVDRDGFEWDSSHASESAIQDVMPGYVIENNGTLEDLEASANTLLATLEIKRQMQL